MEIHRDIPPYEEQITALQIDTNAQPWQFAQVHLSGAHQKIGNAYNQYFGNGGPLPDFDTQRKLLHNSFTALGQIRNALNELGHASSLLNGFHIALAQRTDQGSFIKRRGLETLEQELRKTKLEAARELILAESEKLIDFIQLEQTSKQTLKNIFPIAEGIELIKEAIGELDKDIKQTVQLRR